METEITQFLIRLMFLVLPGVTWRMVFVQLTGNREKKDWEDFFTILFYSILSYIGFCVLANFAWCFLFLLKSPYADSLVGITPDMVLSPFIDSAKQVNLVHILFAILCSAPLGFISAWFYGHKIINKIGQHVGVTKHYGDQDVWEFLMNSPKTRRVVVRDNKLNLVYYGILGLFSDDKIKDDRELILYNVDVFSNIQRNASQENPNKMLYNTPLLYLCRKRDELSVEIPVLDELLR